MLTENDKTIDGLPEISIFLIAMVLDGLFNKEGSPAPTIEEDPHEAHLLGFGSICYN
ncbi:MAG: hypothetical protein H0V65_03735 [Chitinophagales bacterium]|jgi:hypothetical protein|nr:hypothetical protein [Chitinophagales bacterium]